MGYFLCVQYKFRTSRSGMGGVVLFIGVQVVVRVEWFFDLGFQGA